MDILNSYGAAQVGVATAKSPCGPYTYLSSFKPLGAESRDMSLFQDGKAYIVCARESHSCKVISDDSSAYLLYASDNNQNFKISKLTSDYHNVASQTSVLSGSTLEAPGIVKRNGVRDSIQISDEGPFDRGCISFRSITLLPLTRVDGIQTQTSISLLRYVTTFISPWPNMGYADSIYYAADSHWRAPGPPRQTLLPRQPELISPRTHMICPLATLPFTWVTGGVHPFSEAAPTSGIRCLGVLAFPKSSMPTYGL